jgi:Ca2+-binding RTX toxin-like protein
MATFFGSDQSDIISPFYMTSGVVADPAGSRPSGDSDTIYGGDGWDVLHGGAGADLIFGDAGSDRIIGAAGTDRLYGGDGDDQLQGGTGADAMYGGAGSDSYSVDGRGDTVHEDADAGDYDIVSTNISYALGPNIEALGLNGTVRNGTGNELDNYIGGNGADNRLNGLSGNDELWGGDGSDTLRGGAGDDTLNGWSGDDRIQGATGADLVYANEGNDWISAGRGADTVFARDGDDTVSGGWGADRLYGGEGDDTFVFAPGDSIPVIRDLIGVEGAPAFEAPGAAAGDVIDVSAIDADATTPGNQAFVFGDLTGTGRLWAVDAGNRTVVYGNVDDDAAPEFAVAFEDGGTLAGALTSDDFIL